MTELTHGKNPQRKENAGTAGPFPTDHCTHRPAPRCKGKPSNCQLHALQEGQQRGHGGLHVSYTDTGVALVLSSFAYESQRLMCGDAMLCYAMRRGLQHGYAGHTHTLKSSHIVVERLAGNASLEFIHAYIACRTPSLVKFSLIVSLQLEMRRREPVLGIPYSCTVLRTFDDIVLVLTIPAIEDPSGSGQLSPQTAQREPPWAWSLGLSLMPLPASAAALTPGTGSPWRRGGSHLLYEWPEIPLGDKPGRKLEATREWSTLVPRLRILALALAPALSTVQDSEHRCTYGWAPPMSLGNLHPVQSGRFGTRSREQQTANRTWQRTESEGQKLNAPKGGSGKISNPTPPYRRIFFGPPPCYS